MSFDYKENSPFQPGFPVSQDKFKGRHDVLDKILRYAKSASEGNIQHFFLTGERGIGKTSIAQFASKFAASGLGMT